MLLAAACVELSPQPSLLEAEGALQRLHDEDQVGCLKLVGWIFGIGCLRDCSMLRCHWDVHSSVR
jgi:hypothetical protein